MDGGERLAERNVGGLGVLAACGIRETERIGPCCSTTSGMRAGWSGAPCRWSLPLHPARVRATCLHSSWLATSIGATTTAYRGDRGAGTSHREVHPWDVKDGNPDQHPDVSLLRICNRTLVPTQWSWG